MGEAFRGNNAVCYWPEKRVMNFSRSQWWWSRIAGLGGMVVVLTMLPGERPNAANGVSLGGSPSLRLQFRPVGPVRSSPRRSEALARRTIQMPTGILPAASVEVEASPIESRSRVIQVVQSDNDATLDSQFRPIERGHLADPEAEMSNSSAVVPAPSGQLPITGYQGGGALPYAVAPPILPAAPLVAPTPYLGIPYGVGGLPVPRPYLGFPYGYGIAPPVSPYPQVPVPVAPYPQLPYPVPPLLAPPLWPY